MAQVHFWGNSPDQLRSLPPTIRAALAWAILELERNPTALPKSDSLDMSTEAMRGEPGLYRIEVGSRVNPPGYRAIYFVERRHVYLIRFRRRDPSTYRGLRRDIGRLLEELRRPSPSPAKEGTDSG